ncbi:monofunctional biosynthetic peptidoglycan transglycosylase [Hymenobacter sp. BT770]|uniref:monofunctional biosynthetic peptidoglycan transglycosylase n=1 Tax=Hymenobacter sp. BT770 TaxID=2886942 RepID=UPI001D1210F6|nr:monofunctional biosynthetic peptidoglycan transglycosylase [Hymenobacter sp. BT770]MCC3152564.1 monofunctional biosynthetic peptidoglycan transglycosylase [Hymenobacter sp. BT770]MDO3414459.1 monofunctional biosynthetic peptidoglycan transglycosylase [Hymenobacter sp. BT770]
MATTALIPNTSVLIKKGIRLLLQVVAALFLASVAWVLIYRWVAPPATWLMLDRRAHAPVGLGYYGIQQEPRLIRYQFRNLDEVAPAVPLALVAAEDQRFLIHHGFDFDALASAAKRNWKGDGTHIVGGSTISQQVAKNVFLWHGRSYVRKAAEAYFTVLIEFLWNKRRIMEMYLSVAEMGDCTFGVEAASQRYFGKSASRVSPAEAALLAGVLPNPLRFRASNPGPAARAKQLRVLRNMRRLGGTTYVNTLINK